MKKSMLESLGRDIEMYRERLMRSAEQKEFNLTHPEVVQISQEADELILKWMLSRKEMLLTLSAMLIVKI